MSGVSEEESSLGLAHTAREWKDSGRGGRVAQEHLDLGGKDGGAGLLKILSRAERHWRYSE